MRRLSLLLLLIAACGGGSSAACPIDDSIAQLLAQAPAGNVRDCGDLRPSTSESALMLAHACVADAMMRNQTFKVVWPQPGDRSINEAAWVSWVESGSRRAFSLRYQGDPSMGRNTGARTDVRECASFIESAGCAEYVPDLCMDCIASSVVPGGCGPPIDGGPSDAAP
jgi:hypothetical protein